MKRNPIALLRMVFRRLPSMPAEKSYITLKRESLEKFGLSGQFWVDKALSFLREELSRLKAYEKDINSSDYHEWEFSRADDDTDDEDEYPFGSPPEESESPFYEDEDDIFPMGDYENDKNDMNLTLSSLKEILQHLQSLLIEIEKITEEQLSQSVDSEQITTVE